VIDLFSKISYSNSQLFEFFSSRKNDLLNEASPRRMVQLIEALSELQLPLFHEGIWGEVRAELVRVLPQLKRGIPTVIRALTYQGCGDEELVRGLLKQAELNWRNGDVEKEVLVSAIEAASRSGLEGVLHDVGNLINEHTELKNSAGQSIKLLVASQRSGVDESQTLHANIDTVFTDSPDGCRAIELMARLGISTLPVSALNYAESVIASSARKIWAKKFLPFTLNSIARIGGHDEFVKIALSTVQLDCLSGEKLLHMLRALDMVSGGDQQTLRDKIITNLTPLVKQLTPRQSRLLWECVPGMHAVHALPPLLRPGREHLNVNAVCIGPYTVEKRTNAHVLRVPRFMKGRRDIEFRQSALSRMSTDEVLIEFSEY
jgi:hypothetical protein